MTTHTPTWRDLATWIALDLATTACRWHAGRVLMRGLYRLGARDGFLADFTSSALDLEIERDHWATRAEQRRRHLTHGRDGMRSLTPTT